jgi:hypothetical protein
LHVAIAGGDVQKEPEERDAEHKCGDHDQRVHVAGDEGAVDQKL